MTPSRTRWHGELGGVSAIVGGGSLTMAEGMGSIRPLTLVCSFGCRDWDRVRLWQWECSTGGGEDGLRWPEIGWKHVRR
uniref:Uncharacterized protein n=1 Tax=Aegilops tauschii subsp. strangulata TaxID=200361 RepID=A0A453P2M4_AEGTS